MDKGTEDGLYISCVASSTNLWALIMDAGTGFSDQVYELSAVFLHKVSFMEYYCYLSNFICIPITGTTVNFDLGSSSGLDNGTVGKELLH